MNLQTIAIVTACLGLLYAVARLVPPIINMIKAVIDVAVFIKTLVAQHEIMWTAHLASHPEDRHRANGKALASSV